MSDLISKLQGSFLSNMQMHLEILTRTKGTRPLLSITCAEWESAEGSVSASHHYHEPASEISRKRWSQRDKRSLRQITALLSYVPNTGALVECFVRPQCIKSTDYPGCTWGPCGKLPAIAPASNPKGPNTIFLFSSGSIISVGPYTNTVQRPDYLDFWIMFFTHT